MDHTQLLDSLRREGTALGQIEIVEVPVATCPGWTLIDLIHHIGGVHRWIAGHLSAGDPHQFERIRPAGPPDGANLASWYHDGLEALLRIGAESAPDRMTPTWFGPRPATFWVRRAAHETAIHRWDAQSATGNPTPIEPAQAVDAIDEMFEVTVPRRISSDDWPDRVTIHLHATDIDGEWLIELGPEGMVVTRAHAKGDVAVRSSAGDLLLVVAGRIPLAGMEVFGDSSLIDRWRRSIRI